MARRLNSTRVTIRPHYSYSCDDLHRDDTFVDGRAHASCFVYQFLRL